MYSKKRLNGIKQKGFRRLLLLKKIFFIVISILITISISIFKYSDVRAVGITNIPLQNMKYPLIKVPNTLISKNFNFSDDVTINGLYGSNDFSFDVDNYWNVNNSAYLNLVFSESDLNTNKNSTLTVYINDLDRKSVV